MVKVVIAAKSAQNDELPSEISLVIERRAFFAAA